MDVAVGTSGFSYKGWCPRFYPPGLPAAKMLRHYATRFGTVEANHTFRGVPSAASLASWAPQVPAGFRVAVKAPGQITHGARLGDGAREPAARLLRALAGLGDKLGPVLFQLPPTMRGDAGRLRAFLEAWPRGRAAAFEFRHPSWFDDATYDVLRAYDAALVAAEYDDFAAPWVPTASWGYARLRKTAYTERELAERAARLRAPGWTRAYAYVMHDEAGLATEYAARIAALVGG